MDMWGALGAIGSVFLVLLNFFVKWYDKTNRARELAEDAGEDAAGDSYDIANKKADDLTGRSNDLLGDLDAIERVRTPTPPSGGSNP